MFLVMQKVEKCLRSTKNIISKLSSNGNAIRSMYTREGIFDSRHFSTVHTGAKPASLEFTVRRCDPELIAPAKPTPRQIKQLSDIDDQRSLRCLYSNIKFYRYHPSMKGKDPVRVIREALSQALVFYYPLAGRLMKGPDQKLFVDCTSEGILFVEADADVELLQFGDPPRPPFPCHDQLFFGDHCPGEGIVNSPMFLIQVTRLKCGGFIFAYRFNHVMCDGVGLGQFLSAVGEIARGAHLPSVIPVWDREILNARDSPRLTCIHHEYEVEDSHVIGFNKLDVVDRSFFFGPSEMLSIRRFVPEHMRLCSTTFEILMACLWRCHTIALQLNPKDEARILYTVNSRGKFNPPLPVGYYGNVFAVPGTKSEAGKLSHSSIGHALELLKISKEKITEEYMHSLADLIVIKGRPLHNYARSLIISDLRRVGWGDVDFGWGKAAYLGAAMKGFDGLGFMVAFESQNGEDGILVLLCLEAQTMERFEKELSIMLGDQ